MYREESDYKIGRFAQFKNREIEEEYFRSDVLSSLGFVRIIVLLCGAIFFAIFFYDLAYYEFDFSKYIHSLLARGIVLVLAVVFFLRAAKFKSARKVTGLITAFELAIVFAYLYILYSQGAQGFTEQAMAMMIIIFGIFMLPNRLINLVFTSVAIAVLFCVGAVITIHDLDVYLLVEVAIMLGAGIAIATGFFYRDNYNKRKRYAESKIWEHISVVDKLTGIYNRGNFDEALEAWCNEGKGKDVAFSVILFDVDHFKKVNDKFGHLLGDKVLQQLARIVEQGIRGTDVFARWGGEEFVILLPNDDIEKAGLLAERLRMKIEQATFEEIGTVTVSFGVVSYKKGDTPVTVMQRVDKALYAAKEGGRNRVCIMDGETDENAL